MRPALWSLLCMRSVPSGLPQGYRRGGGGGTRHRVLGDSQATCGCGDLVHTAALARVVAAVCTAEVSWSWKEPAGLVWGPECADVLLQILPVSPVQLL